MIEKARVGSAESSALGYVDAVEKQIAINLLDKDITDITEGTYTIEELTNLKVNVKGTNPSSGTVVVTNKVESATLCIGNYKVEYQNNKAKATKDSSCTTNTPSTYTVYANGTAIYFNPETGAKCTAGEAVSTTGTKTGCMKWYTFNDDGASSSTINLILDHNTTAKVAWNSTRTNISGPDKILTKLASDTSSWVGVPTRTDSYSVSNGTSTYTINYSTYKARLIKASEIATITGNSSFVEATTPFTSWFYLDSNNQTKTATTTGASNYDWLFDYTNGCTSYGCNIADASNFGYWTSTAVSGGTINAWNVNRNGQLFSSNVETSGDDGVRPVITILKSNL